MEVQCKGSLKKNTEQWGWWEKCTIGLWSNRKKVMLCDGSRLTPWWGIRGRGEVDKFCISFFFHDGAGSYSEKATLHIGLSCENERRPKQKCRESRKPIDPMPAWKCAMTKLNAVQWNLSLWLLSATQCINWINKKGVVLTVEMPDQQSSHKCNNSNEDHQTDHSPNPSWSLFLLKFFIIWCWQELDRSIPVFVLEQKGTMWGVNSWTKHKTEGSSVLKKASESPNT